MYKDVQLFINGQWQPSVSGRTLSVVNPATEAVIGNIAHANREDLDAAVASAQKGFEIWRNTSAFERSKIMRKAANILRERAAEIAQLMTQEQGKPLAEAKGETLGAADTIDWFAEEARRNLRSPGAGPRTRRLSDGNQGAGRSGRGIHAMEFPDQSSGAQIVGRVGCRLLHHRQGAGRNPGIAGRTDPCLC